MNAPNNKISVSVPKNTIVKIEYTQSYRKDYTKRTAIATYKYEKKYNCSEYNHYFFFGHPYDLDSKKTTRGECGVTEEDLLSMKPVTQQEVCLWLQNYKDFHEKIIKATQLNDPLEEDFRTMKIYRKKELA